MADLFLAIAHHILVFGLVGMLTGEAVLVRPGMSSADAARVARLDAGYGAAAGLILLIGILRLVFGAKGLDYYLVNVWFWGKIAAFACMGLASIPPTLRFFAWRAALKANPSYVPDAHDIARVKFLLRLQSLLLVAIIAFAATMARYATY